MFKKFKKHFSAQGGSYSGEKKGFSLIELLVVITIIAILSVTAFVALGGQTIKAKNSKRLQDLGTIQSALEIYAISKDSRYPGSGDLKAELTPKYLSKLLNDPAKDIDGNAIGYKYKVAGNLKSYQLGATLENEEYQFGYKAYVIGNGSGLITDGCEVGSSGCDCGSSCAATDESEVCVPYCL